MIDRLDVRDLHASYGKAPVLRGVSFNVGAGEIVSLLGRNGAGRSTVLRAIMGLIESQGSVNWCGRELNASPTHVRSRLGLGYVSERRDLIARLTVEQNLRLGEKVGANGRRSFEMERAFALFPALKERRQTSAGVLSGGEQQQLALARALMGNPDLLLVDEPTEGLAPRLVEQVAALLQGVREQGIAVLLVEQKLAIALDISQRCLVLGQGRIVFDGAPDALRGDAAVRQEWLAV